jgi:superfamily II DNA or RNA helicase
MKQSYHDIRLIRRDPDKAYVSNMLWLPKAMVAEKAIKEGLQYWDVEGNVSVMRRLWEETQHHLICPREYIKISQYPQFPFPFVDLTPKKFPEAKFNVVHEPRDDTQSRAYEALKNSSGGILNLACGKGKTFLALKHASDLGCPLLVVVHNSYLLNQWIDEAIPKHVILPGEEKVGLVQGQHFDWKRPITVAMIQTLASRIEDGRLPPEFSQYFGMVVYDEVHHLSAPVFATTAPAISGLRYGLTATERRLDGYDFIYKYHIGDIFHTDLVQKILPRIYFQYTPVYVDLKKADIYDIKGDLNIPMLRSWVGDMPEANAFRAKCIQEALNHNDRKILCVSHSKNQLINLHKMFPGAGLIVEETPPKERASIVRNSKVTFAIAKLGFEGLDDDTLDTVFILLPFKSPNDLQQVMGRIQREKEGKNTPNLIIFDDVRIKQFHGMCSAMKSHLNEWDKHVPGMPKLEFSILNAPNF